MFMRYFIILIFYRRYNKFWEYIHLKSFVFIIGFHKFFRFFYSFFDTMAKTNVLMIVFLLFEGDYIEC